MLSQLTFESELAFVICFMSNQAVLERVYVKLELQIEVRIIDMRMVKLKVRWLLSHPDACKKNNNSHTPFKLNSCFSLTKHSPMQPNCWHDKLSPPQALYRLL